MHKELYNQAKVKMTDNLAGWLLIIVLTAVIMAISNLLPDNTIITIIGMIISIAQFYINISILDIYYVRKSPFSLLELKNRITSGFKSKQSALLKQYLMYLIVYVLATVVITFATTLFMAMIFTSSVGAGMVLLGTAVVLVVVVSVILYISLIYTYKFAAIYLGRQSVQLPKQMIRSYVLSNAWLHLIIGFGSLYVTLYKNIIFNIVIIDYILEHEELNPHFEETYIINQDTLIKEIA